MIYSAFGLGLEFDRPIPRLAGSRSAAQADVRVTLDSMPAWRDPLIRTAAEPWHVRRDPDAPDTPTLTIWKLGPDYIRLLYGDGVDFLLARDGSAIWTTWPDTSSLDDVSSYLLGPVLGFVLRLRGFTCLHASGALIDGRAVLFAGISGAGKSTTAAALLAHGYPTLADDVVPLVRRGDRWFAVPSYPRLRLWPRSVHATGLSDGSFDWNAERRCHVDLAARHDAFHHDPAPLGAIYMIDRARTEPAAAAADPMTPAAGVMAMTAHTFATTLLDAEGRAREFEDLSSVAMNVPIRRLRVPNDLSALARLCDLLVDDLRQLEECSAAV